MKLIIGMIISAIVLGGTCEDGPIIEEPWGVIIEEEVVAEEVPEERPHITKQSGVFDGPSGKETYYNLKMGLCIDYMRELGYDAENYPYWVRNDGAKMLGDYVMCAADLSIRPKGTILETSLGKAIVVDTGTFAHSNPTQIDLAVCW